MPCILSLPTGGSQSDATFTKPATPPERTIAHKLADEILRTGESTNELIALGETPVTRPRTRSATKAVAESGKALTVDKRAADNHRSVADGGKAHSYYANSRAAVPVLKFALAYCGSSLHPISDALSMADVIWAWVLRHGTLVRILYAPYLSSYFMFSTSDSHSSYF